MPRHGAGSNPKRHQSSSSCGSAALLSQRPVLLETTEPTTTNSSPSTASPLVFPKDAPFPGGRLEELISIQLVTLQQALLLNSEIMTCARESNMKLPEPPESGDDSDSGAEQSFESANEEPAFKSLGVEKSGKRATNSEFEKQPISNLRGSNPATTVRTACDLSEPLLSSNLSPKAKDHLLSSSLTEIAESTPAEHDVDTSEKRGEKASRRTIFFPQLGDIKDTLLENTPDKNLHTEDFYFENGWAQSLARSNKFINFILGVIVFNTIWIAVETDNNKAEILSEAPLIFQVVDNAMCGIFVFEIVIRFSAFKTTKYALKDIGFVFDSVLVILMAWETWALVFLHSFCGFTPTSNSKAFTILRIFRLTRLTRVVRSARLVNSVPELMILAEGMMVAMRAVASILFLLGLAIYIFAIIFTQLLEGSQVAESRFESVPQSMNFLLIQVLAGFDAEVFAGVLQVGFAHYLIYIIFVLVASLTMMNMLIGVLCEVVSTVSESERDKAFVEELDAIVMNLALTLDATGDGFITEAEFENVRKNPDLAHALDEHGVDVASFLDYASFVFQECTSISYQDFAMMVGQFRQDKGTTIKDMMDLRKYIALELTHLQDSIAIDNDADPHLHHQGSSSFLDRDSSVVAELNANLHASWLGLQPGHSSAIV